MKKLFICSEFYAGLLPFGANIVNSMRGDDCFGIFVCTPECDYRKVLIPNGLNYQFIDFPNKRIRKLQAYLYSPSLLKAIRQVCGRENIEVIHLLTEDTSLAFFLKSLKKKAKVFYTVHDLFAHEKVYKNPLHWLIRKVLVEQRVKYMIRQSDCLVTCSKFQYEWMLKNFPDREIGFHHFPTLVTDVIKSGNASLPELAETKNYILFFGLLEKYKGVDILYEAFLKTEPAAGKTLVIAGKGYIYFKRDQLKEKDRVIFINRYIKDDEIRSLFQNASWAVFPYISGTQSGILTIPYYFCVPTILSDIQFFRELIEAGQTSKVFKIGDISSLTLELETLNGKESEMLTARAHAFYQETYNPLVLKRQLSSLYELSCIE
jgi:glycosyltransferase involved in cell wall biosynthesis